MLPIKQRDNPPVLLWRVVYKAGLKDKDGFKVADNDQRLMSVFFLL